MTYRTRLKDGHSQEQPSALVCICGYDPQINERVSHNDCPVHNEQPSAPPAMEAIEQVEVGMVCLSCRTKAAVTIPLVNCAVCGAMLVTTTPTKLAASIVPSASTDVEAIKDLLCDESEIMCKRNYFNQIVLEAYRRGLAVARQSIVHGYSREQIKAAIYEAMNADDVDSLYDEPVEFTNHVIAHLDAQAQNGDRS